MVFAPLEHAQTPVPVGCGPRPRAHGVIVVKHHIPVDAVPPSLQELVLARDSVVHHPRVLPCVDAENGLHVNGPGGQVLRVLGVGAHGTGKLVTQRGIGGVGGHVDGLPPRVGGRVGGAGVVGTEDLEHTVALKVLGEPDKTGAEHGAGGSQEVQLKGLDR